MASDQVWAWWLAGLCAAGAANAACPLFLRYGHGYDAVVPPSIAPTSFGVAGAALPDGRLIAVTGNEVYVETEAGSGAWRVAGILPAPAEPTFVGVSPSGARVAVGMNPLIAAFDANAISAPGGAPTLIGSVGVLFEAEHFDGTWIDDSRLALSGPGGNVLEAALSGDGAVVIRTIVTNIGGASGGVGVDSAGNLFTGNGFDFFPGGSETGWVKAFAPALWEAGTADFESQGVLVCDMLSAGGLRFDSEGNLFVTGGDFGTGDTGYVGVVRATALKEALAGSGPVNTTDPTRVRRLAPMPDPFAFYAVIVNRSRGEVVATLVDFSTNVASWHRTEGRFDLPGDANGDHVVDFADLSIVLDGYGTSTGGGSSGGDLNGDGRVDFLDLNIVLGGFGGAC